MEHDSGRPEDLAASEDLPAGDGWEHPDDVAGEQDVTGVAQVWPTEAQVGSAEARVGSAETQGWSAEAQVGSAEAQVDEVIAGLDGLPGRPLAEHVAVFEEAHAKLRRVLSDLDDGPADS